MMKQSSSSQDERIATPREWARQQFGSCDLGDQRRTRRLVSYAALQMENPEASTNSVCQGNDAVAEGAYRLLRNEKVKPEAIEQGPFRYTAEQAAKREVVLAIQDTSSVSYPHSVVQQLGDLGGGRSGDKGRGFWVHSTLIVDAQSSEPIGLIDQVRWMRDKDRKPSRHERKERRYEDKESYKWQQAHERMTARLNTTTNVISVADREADVFEYLQYLGTNNQRYVVRAAQDRALEPLETNDGRLWEFMAKQPVVATRIVDIRQRGAQRATSGQKKRAARKARKAQLQVRAAKTTLRVPKSKVGECNPIVVRVVYLVETDPPEGQERCEWMLLTTEPIDAVEQVKCIIGYYETRWLIEDFHKAWKTGCGVELRRQQSVDNLERLMVILAPMAVQILRLRTLAQSESSTPCDIVLSEDQWRCLHAKSHHKKRTTKRKPRLPRKAPTLAWALESIAKLGGWRRTKNNPLPGWITLWRGWLKLEDYVEGWQLARSADA